MTLDPELRELNASAIHELQTAWRDRRLSVIVGAGASHQAGLPLWRQLLERMLALWVQRAYKDSLVEGLSAEIQEHIGKQLRAESPIVTAHYLQAKLSDRDFVDLVHQALYGDLTEQPSPGSILRAIGRLGPRLRSVVTFNFDALTEMALRLEGTESSTVARASDLGRSNALPVYHPHGYLPFEREPDTGYSVVIGEAEYHTLYSDPQSWNNVVFSSALLESTCLFVATSITDPNVRRVIDAVHRQTPDRKHYFLWSTPRRQGLKGLDRVLHDIFVDVFEQSHARLGLEPVWFYWRDGLDSHADVPHILDAVRES